MPILAEVIFLKAKAAPPKRGMDHAEMSYMQR
jgi:hypothetical protein